MKRKENLSNLLSVYILFRNRDSHLAELIKSIQNQKIPLENIILSDNSNKEKNNLISEKNKKKLFDLNIKIQTRIPELKNVWEHIKICVSECNTPYVCMLHDDDLLENNFSQWLENIILEKPSELERNVAVAPNAYFSFVGKTCKRLFRENKDFIVLNQSVIIEKYFSFSKISDIAPFPAYVYQTESLKKVLEKPLNLGIYSDIELLSRLTILGPIKWSRECCFNYKLHGENMSSHESFRDRLRILSWIKNSKKEMDIIIYRRWLLVFFLRKINFTIKDSRKRKYTIMILAYLFKKKPIDSLLFFLKLACIYINNFFLKKIKI